MRKIHLVAATLSLVAVLSSAASASAEGQSNRGAGYVQLNPLGFAIAAGGAGSAAAFHLDLEGGYHFGGGHDGFVLGFRQGFNFASFTSGSTQAKFGYGIAIPVGGGKNEITVEPYGALGVAYFFAGGDPLFAFGLGLDVRYFFLDQGGQGSGLFIGGHPIELGGWIGQISGFTYIFGLGIGYAF